GLLGRFWCRGDAVRSRVGQLSGGERARLALAKFIAQDYDLLVLDEPTNHLDIESQEIVAAALGTYPGMLLVVSHNRSFLNEVANKIAMVAHRRLAVFQGTFRDSWAAAKMAEFMAVRQKPRYRVLRVVKDWETGTAYHGGDVIALHGRGPRPSCACCGGRRQTAASSALRREGSAGFVIPRPAVSRNGPFGRRGGVPARTEGDKG